MNAALEIGEVTQSVEVSVRPQLLETETSETGSLVDGKRYYDLPSYQRWIASSFQLVPGRQQSAARRPIGVVRIFIRIRRGQSLRSGAGKQRSQILKKV